MKNFMKEENTAMKSLKSNLDITINEADRSYTGHLSLQQLFIQLSYGQYYSPVTTDLTDDFSQKMHDYLHSLYTRDIISKTIYDRLITHKPRTPAFYHNPKVHKPPRQIYHLVNGRAMETILAFVDICLNPLVPLIPSYMKDSIHFIQYTFHSPHGGLLLSTYMHGSHDLSNIRCLLPVYKYPQHKGIEVVKRMIRLHRTQVVGQLHMTNRVSVQIKSVCTPSYFVVSK